MAGGTVKSLLVRLGIDSRALDTGLTKAEKQTKRVEGQMAAMTAASKRAEAAMALQAQKAKALAVAQKAVADTAKKASIAFTAMAVAGAAVITKTTLLAARVETLGVVVQQVGKNAGYSEDQINKFEEGVKAMGITTQAARASLARMAQAQIHWSNASKLARIAQDAAVIGNMNSSESFEKLTYVLQTGNVRMGRTLGLNLDFQRSYEEMAARIGTVAADLNGQQKIQARVNEVMRASIGIQGAYEASMETAGKKMQSLKRIFEEIQFAVGENFLPLFTQLIDKVTTFGNAILNMDPQLRSTIVIFGGIMTAVAGIVGALTGLIAILPAIKAGIVTLGIAINASTGGILLLVGAIVTVIAALAAWATAEKMKNDGIMKAADETAAAANSYIVYKKTMLDAAASTGALIVTQEEYQRLMSGDARLRGMARNAIVLQTEAEWEHVRALETAKKAQTSYALATLERLRETSPAFADYRYELEGVSEAELEAINATRDLSTALDAIVIPAWDAGRSFADMGLGIGDMDMNVDKAIEELQEFLNWLLTEGARIATAIKDIKDKVMTGEWTVHTGQLALEGLKTGGVGGMSAAVIAQDRVNALSDDRMFGGVAGPTTPSIGAPDTPFKVEIVSMDPDISEPWSAVESLGDLISEEDKAKVVNIMEHAIVTIERQMDERELALLLARLI